MKTKRSTDYWMIAIISIALFLRTFRISALTEFLGDQGRTMLIMRDFLANGIVPLVGPATLSGHNLGPVFYYLLVPGYPGGPVGMSLWVALLGVIAVALMYETTRLMFGLWPARLTSFLWAVSPLIVFDDRVIWEPNLVPFFAVLFIYLLYRAHVGWLRWMWVAMGAVVGILIQLHYPNVFFAGLTGLYLIGCVIFRLRKGAEVLRAGLWWIVGLLVALVPFMIYESAHGFENISGVLSIIKSGGGEIVGKRVMLSHAMDYSFRAFGRVLPYMALSKAPFLVSVWILLVVLMPSKKNIFFSVWFFGGIAAMARYAGIVYDHYLNFLTPVPFFLIGSVIASAKNKPWKKAVIGFVAILCLLQLIQTDVFTTGNNDIARVEGAVGKIQALVGESPFSFTLIGSRSYSDLHYRYYMKAMHVNPGEVADAGYRKFILVCDQETCPTVPEITGQSQLSVLCYEEHCKGFYPTVPLQKEWKYQSDMPITENGRQLGWLYVFERR